MQTTRDLKGFKNQNQCFWRTEMQSIRSLEFRHTVYAGNIAYLWLQENSTVHFLSDLAIKKKTAVCRVLTLW